MERVERSLVDMSYFGETIKRVTRLRNLIIHRYWEVDDSRIYRERGEKAVSE